jgi:hypothetical protein
MLKKYVKIYVKIYIITFITKIYLIYFCIWQRFRHKCPKSISLLDFHNLFVTEKYYQNTINILLSYMVTK